MLMKGVHDAATAKDGTVEGGTVVARAVGLAAVPSIAGLSACGFVRRDKGRGAGAHGDVYRTG
ncbi:MAG: hypothetical protein E5W81_01470 [Mesorhizobium sp.]|nr:MAG: hypothetical protein E5W81_01470 [Mesorhizobium sp.]